MPLITRLVQGKKNPSRVNLYLDGQFAFALSIDEVVKQGLKKGLELSLAQAAALKDEDATEYLYAKILNFLSFRPRSVKEVCDRLYKYNLKDPAKQDIFIARLTSRGYLSDLEFARWFINSRNTHRPRSAIHLTQELQKKGISREIIASLAGEFADESQVIKQQLSKRLGSPHALTPPARQKIYAYLGRHGFSWQLIKEVVKSWESE